MVTVSEYAADIIKEMQSSHARLESLSDKPGDLDIIRSEWHRSLGLSRALVDRIEASKTPAGVLEGVVAGCKRFDGYDFSREIDLLYGLYEKDPNRLKNIRLKMLEAFEETRLLKHIRYALEAMGESA